MVASGIVDDVDYFLSGHIGLGNGENNSLVCMTEGFLATSKIDAFFTGKPAHAGANPQNGRNALLAAAQASLASIPFPVTATALPALMWEFSRQGRDETSSPTTRSSNLRPVAVRRQSMNLWKEKPAA